MSQFSKAYELLSVWSKGTALYGRWANQCEIGYPELMVLYALYTRDHLTQKRITEEFGLIKATVSTVIRDLKRRELILLESGQEDKREKRVIFTEAGREYAQNIIQPLLETEEQISKKIGDARMEQVIDTLDLYNLLFEKELKAKGK